MNLWFTIKYKKESGTEIGNSLEFDFVEISVVEPTQPLRLARQFKDN